MKHQFKTYYIILLFVIIWNILIFLPPILKPSFPLIANFLYSSFYHICHQFDSRSFHIFGEKLAVCSRCCGIYAGFMIGMIIIPFVKNIKPLNSKNLIIIGLIPIFLDIFLDAANIHESIKTTKLLSGLIFGLVSAQVVFPSLNEGLSYIIEKYKRRKQCTRNQRNSPQLYMVE